MLFLILFFQEAPKQIQQNWATFNSIGILITWVTFILFLFQHKRNAEKNRRELEDYNERLIKRVCTELIYSENINEKYENRTKELARFEIDAAFTKRSESFVDSKEYKASNRHINETLSEIKTIVKENTRIISETKGKLDQIVLADRADRRRDLEFDDTQRRK